MNQRAAAGEAAATPVHGAHAYDARVRQDQAESLLGTGIIASVFAFLVAAGMWAIFYYQLRQPGVLVWAALIHGVQAWRFAFHVRYRKTPPALRDPVSAAGRYSNALAVNGAVWGLAPWLFFPAGNLPLTTLMMMLLLGMVSGGMAALAPYRRALFSFTVPLLAGLAAAMLWRGDVLHLYLALCTLAYMYVSLKFGLQQNRLLTEALRARYEIEALSERLAQQVEIVERASAEKTRFFASASHDLRQPLHSLGLFGAALLTRLQATPEETLARNMLQCVDALETSFSAMLDVSRLDAGAVVAEPRPVALAHVFRHVEATFIQEAQARNLALRFKPGGKWVHGDAAIVQRIIGNLVHNALKFTREGGIAVLARRRAGAVSIEVWDTGRGMAREEWPRIFEEFYQVGNLERDRSKGLGMGLAIVQRLARLLGAGVQVQSRTGRGSVFRFSLPSASAQVSALPPAAAARDRAPPGALVGKRVLVVDDEQSIRESMREALGMHGMQVEVADGMEQALMIARRQHQPVDALITDFRLRNGENGIELATQLRALLGQSLPVLLITGDTAPERVLQAKRSGLTVLYKPVKSDDLLHVLHTEMRLAILPA